MDILTVFADYIRNIALFLIFLTFMGAIMPRGKFKPYMGMVLGVMLMFVVIAPIRVLFNGGGLASIWERTNDDFGLSLMRAEGAGLTDTQREQALAAYADSLSKSLAQLIDTGDKYKAGNISLEMSDDNADFGIVRAAYIRLDDKDSKPNGTFGIRIEPVNPIYWGGRAEKTDAETNTIKKQISDFLNVPEDNIYITVYGD